ncbi:E3 ubiquitin ligase [Babesia ovis]|uniref:E3 ubiquitin ligase n=1 Tax=Babesia ovis TaxID=5869 RepID=A0A9W5WWG7_BABOV|nr:E3 ubiquitin ligase [Babesia ovis]
MDEYVLKHFDWSAYANQARSRFLEGKQGVLQSCGFNNLVSGAVVCAIIGWALRLWMEFRSIHQVQEQMRSIPKILHLKNMAEFASDLLSLTKEHFNAIVKLRHNPAPLPVARIHMPATLIASSLHMELKTSGSSSDVEDLYTSDNTSSDDSSSDDGLYTNGRDVSATFTRASNTTADRHRKEYLDNLSVSFKMDCSRTTFVSAHWGVPVSVLQQVCVGSRKAVDDQPGERFSFRRFFKGLLKPYQDDVYQGLLDYDETTVLDAPDDKDERFGRFSVLAHSDKLCTTEAVCYDAGEAIACTVTPTVKTLNVEGRKRSIWEVLLSRYYGGEEIVPLVIVLYSPRAHDTRVFSEGSVESYQGVAEITMVGFAGRPLLSDRFPMPLGIPTGISVDVTKQVCFSNEFGRPQEPRDMFGMGDELDTDCLICLSNRMDTVLLPCGHASFCFSCLQSLRSEKCPVCRGSFTSYIKFPLVKPTNG